MVLIPFGIPFSKYSYTIVVKVTAVAKGSMSCERCLGLSFSNKVHDFGTDLLRWSASTCPSRAYFPIPSQTDRPSSAVLGSNIFLELESEIRSFIILLILVMKVISHSGWNIHKLLHEQGQRVCH
jgi:hypothetical protein